MTESKPTKLQMAKEIQHLIAAAQDMSAVMDLDPVIKTDYLIDLKNKTVTVSHLNHVIGSLQADMKAVAVEIEPEDKFQPDTHRVLADLNVKVPRPAAKEEVVEDEGDDVIPTPSPPMEEEPEKEKPIKKEKKKKAQSGPGVIASILEFIQESKEGISKVQIAEKLAERFPDRDANSMAKTINAQIGGKKSPRRMEKEKGVVFNIDEDLYSIK